MANRKTLRPPVKWHGGKRYLCHQIVELFSAHRTYVEPFGGAASVLLNKPPADVEVYNDLDERITRLFRVLRDEGDELRRRLTLTPYSEIEFNQASEPAADEIELARRDFVRWRMSMGGRGDAFSYTLHRVRRKMADVVSGYLSAIDDELPAIIERLRRVQILQRPALEVIQKWDGEDTLFYCDPPYVAETREKHSRDIYGSEMSDDGHRELTELLNRCKGQVVVSGYACPLYEEAFTGWQRIEIDIANHAATSSNKQRKKECLWLNFKPTSDHSLF